MNNPTPGSITFDWRPELDAYDSTLVEAARAVAEFVGEIAAGRPPRWLTLAGVTGSGKTHLAKQTYQEARKHRDAATATWTPQSGIYDERNRRPFYRWIDEAEFARLMFDDKQWDLAEYLAHEWLVVYDDLGTKFMGSTAAQTQLSDAIMRLANRRLGKWTLWTTNLKLDEIRTRIDGRVASRLIRDGNRFVTITAGDYALRKKKL